MGKSLSLKNSLQREPFLECCILEITLACNLSCIHCGSYAGKCRNDELSVDEIFKLIDDLKNLNCQQITIMGGEFLLRKEWYEICKYVTDKDIKLIIITNGFGLSNNIVKKIKTLNPYSVALSIDGTEEIHDKIRGVKGSFQKVIKSIKELKNEGIDIGIITTLNKLNVECLPELKEILYLLDSGLRWQIQTACHGHKLTKDMLVDNDDFIYICNFIEKSQNEKKYNPNKLLIKGADDIGYYPNSINSCISADSNWKGCKAGIYVLGIQSNGNVKGCLSLPDEYIEGNVKEKSIIEIWNDKNFCNFSRNFDEANLGENCKGCKYGKICKGGCTEVSFSRTGKAHNAPLCLYKMGK